jgi:hypothetical protein
VKRQLDDAMKMAQGAFESAKQGAQEMTRQPLPAKKGQPAQKGVEPAAKKSEPPPSVRQAEPPPVKQAEPPPVKQAEPPPTPKAEEPPPVVAKPEPPPATPPEEPAPVVAAKPAEPPLGDDDDDDDLLEEPAPPSDTPGAKLEQQMSKVEPLPPIAASSKKGAPAPRGPSTKEARALLDAGKIDAAIQTLYVVRRHTHGSAEAAMLLGHAYFKKQWRTDGLREYNTALKLMPSLRWNRVIQRNTVSALEGPTYRLARAVIKARLGAAALPDVRHLARTTRSPRLRAHATRLAQQLAHARRR